MKAYIAPAELKPRSGGISCDDCGVQVNFERPKMEKMMAKLRKQGWTGPMNSPLASKDNPDLCPACTRKQQGQLRPA